MLELNHLYNLDCMDGMKQFPNKYFELAICDPPYGIKINMNMGRKKGVKKAHADKEWDNDIPDDEFFKQLFRVSQNQIIWGGKLFSIASNKELDILGQISRKWRVVCRWRTCLDIV